MAAVPRYPAAVRTRRALRDPARDRHTASTYQRYTPAVDLPPFWLFVIVGVSVVIGRNRPVLLTAVLFLVIGSYVGGEAFGQGLTAELDHLVRRFT